MIKVALLLGANEGDTEATLAGVTEQIERSAGRIVSRSSVVRTKAWGFASADFSNQAVVVETALEPLALLDELQAIEQRWGRDREREAQEKSESGERYCARTIDIDIIFYGEQSVCCERLTIPHALMAQREFVLQPLAQIAPHWRHSESGKSVEQMLNELREG